MRRNRSPKWTPTILFFLFWLGASVTPLSAQSNTADQVWGQLQSWRATAAKDGFKQFNYIVAWLNKGTSPSINWPLDLPAGSSYLIVGVCDNDCADVDLALEDKDRAVIASDTAPDDMPVIRFTPSTATVYWIRVTMPDCRVEPCGYGIGVFVK